MEIIENEKGGVWSKLADRRVGCLFLWGNLASKSQIEPLGVGEPIVHCNAWSLKLYLCWYIIEDEIPIY